MADYDNRNSDDLSYYYGTENNAESRPGSEYIDAYADKKTTDEPAQKGPFAYVFSALFLIWFLGSVIALIWLSKTDNDDIAIAVFGQVFLIFGLIGTVSMIKSKNFQAFVLLFPLIGTGCLFFSLTYHFMPDSREDINDLLPYLVLALFFVIGLGVFLYGILGPVMLKKKCSQSIMGRVVKLDQKNDDGTTLYCPTFEIWHRSEMKTICNNLYSNISVPQMGESVELFINPDDPSQFYIPSQNGKLGLFLIFFGLIFMAVPVISFFAMMMQQ